MRLPFSKKPVGEDSAALRVVVRSHLKSILTWPLFVAAPFLTFMTAWFGTGDMNHWLSYIGYGSMTAETAAWIWMTAFTIVMVALLYDVHRGVLGFWIMGMFGMFMAVVALGLWLDVPIFSHVGSLLDNIDLTITSSFIWTVGMISAVFVGISFVYSRVDGTWIFEPNVIVRRHLFASSREWPRGGKTLSYLMPDLIETGFLGLFGTLGLRSVNGNTLVARLPHVPFLFLFKRRQLERIMGTRRVVTENEIGERDAIADEDAAALDDEVVT